MGNEAATPSKIADPAQPLRWLTVVAWMAGLFAIHFYFLRSIRPEVERPLVVELPVSLAVFLTICLAFHAAGALISGLAWRRFPRAKGLFGVECLSPHPAARSAPAPPGVPNWLAQTLRLRLKAG